MKVLTISYLQTKSFVIDYVNLSEQSTESVKNISVGASSTGGGDGTTTSSSGGNSDTTTIKTKSDFQFWDKLSQEIDAILSRDNDIMKIKSKSIINREAGVITITGTTNQIDRIDQYLSKIKDRLHKQVVLETTILEYTSIDGESNGVDWSKFNLSLKGNVGRMWDDSGSSSGTSFAYDFSMEGLIDFLNKNGKVNVLSKPKIRTLNNRAAVINVGKQINYRYQSGTLSTANATSSTSNTYTMSSVFIGLTLSIVPEITDDGYIVLQINPVVSETVDPDSDLDATSNGDAYDMDGVRIMPPDIRIKQLSSIVKVKDRGKVIVGGLISTEQKNSSSKVPLLGDLPGLGWLFKSKSKVNYKTELIIIITPKLIKNNSFPSIDNFENSIEGLNYE
jgi:general secretion pathway protein D